MAVGILDSSLGGLTLVDAVMSQLPDVPLVYLSDDAHAPYGVATADVIFEKTTAATQRLFDAGCDLVVLASGTSSAVALRKMQESWVPQGKRVLGAYVPLIESLVGRAWGDNSAPRPAALRHVAHFATPAAAQSRAFQRELAFRATGIDVETQACAGVVDALEDGDGILAEAIVRSHVAALLRRMPAPDAAVLGCSHAASLVDVFQDALGTNVKILRQMDVVADSLADYLERRPEMVGAGEGTVFLTTGDPVVASDRATAALRRQIAFEAA